MTEFDDRTDQLGEMEAMSLTTDEGKFNYNAGPPTTGCYEITFGELETPIILTGDYKQGGNREAEIKALPPVFLNFFMREKYPSNVPLEVDITCYWMTLDQKAQLEEELGMLCLMKKGEFQVFYCSEKIREFVADLVPVMRRIRVNDCYKFDVEAGRVDQFINKLVNSSKKVMLEIFNNSFFTCVICLEGHLGSESINCVKCENYVCKTCMKSYFKNTLETQFSGPLKCCACKELVKKTLIESVLDEEEFADYQERLYIWECENSPDKIPCSRSFCTAYANIINAEKHIAQCPSCYYVFCMLCGRTNHGVEDCKFSAKDKAEILEAYDNASEETRKQLSTRFGGMANYIKTIDKMRVEKWLSENSKKCPKCHVNIEKTEGCHKMHCTKCDTMFCWLCLAVLDKNNPYGHFNEGTCSGMLFHGIADSDDDEDWFEDDDAWQGVFDEEDEDDHDVFEGHPEALGADDDHAYYEDA